MSCLYCGKPPKKSKNSICLTCALELWGVHESVLKFELNEAIAKNDEGKIQVLNVFLEMSGSKI